MNLSVAARTSARLGSPGAGAFDAVVGEGVAQEAKKAARQRSGARADFTDISDSEVGCGSPAAEAATPDCAEIKPPPCGAQAAVLQTVLHLCRTSVAPCWGL